MAEICLQHLKDNRYEIIDCQTGEPTNPCRVGDRRRRTRAPSPYNIHMKECLKRTSGPIRQRFKSCAEEWRKK